jgi:hypothetical protein
MSGVIGLDTVTCEKVTYGPGAPFSLRSFRSFLKLQQLILDL